MVLLFSPTNRKIDVTVCTLDCLLWTFAIAPTAIVVFRSKKVDNTRDGVDCITRTAMGLASNEKKKNVVGWRFARRPGRR